MIHGEFHIRMIINVFKYKMDKKYKNVDNLINTPVWYLYLDKDHDLLYHLTVPELKILSNELVNVMNDLDHVSSSGNANDAETANKHEKIVINLMYTIGMIIEDFYDQKMNYL